MRSYPAEHRFTFLLPPNAAAVADFQHPLVEVEIVRGAVVTVRGPSREAAFEAAACLLREACRGLPPLSIAGLHHVATDRRADGRDWLLVPGPSDGWTIIVGADVAFSPTGLDPHIPRPAAPSRI